MATDAPEGMVRVDEKFFGIAVSRLQEDGVVHVTKFPIGGASVRCTETRREVAHQYAGEYGSVTTFVAPDFFSHITVQGNRYRDLNATEREIICRKLEARVSGNVAKEAEYNLPPWTIGIYEKAVADGLKSFRGRTSQVAMPFTMTFEQAVIPEVQERTSPVHSQRMS